MNVQSHSPDPSRSVRLGRPGGSALLPTLLVCVSVLAGPLVTTSAEGGELSQAKCYRATLSHMVDLATSGAVAPSGDGILLVDTQRDQILRVDAHGRVRLARPRTLFPEKGMTELKPFGLAHKIRPYGDQYLLLYVHSEAPPFRIAEMDQDLRLGDPLAIPRSPAVIHDFTPLGERGVLIFGNFFETDDPRNPVFVYYDAKSAKSIVYRERTLSLAERDGETAFYFYLYLNMPFMASFGGTGYVLFFEGEQASLGRVEAGGKEIVSLHALPEDFRNLPHLSDDFLRLRETRDGPRQATRLLRLAEGSRMPMGLYAWNDILYLLAKEKIDSLGETIWWLISLDPQTGEETGRIELPSRAAHLTVVPGDEFWTLVEKQRVQPQGARGAPYMRTASLIMTPSTWLTPGQGIRTLHTSSGAGDLCETLSTSR